MSDDIAFLHTSRVHVPTFESLLQACAPGLRATHRVREDLLALAQARGVSDLALHDRVREALAEAARGGAKVVVCTCSTLGSLAEAADAPDGLRVTRVDRAMADAAVRHGGRVLLAAALPSTLQPTQELLHASASRLGVRADIDILWIESAWPHFEAGRIDDYTDCIVDAVTAADPRGVVLLAQVSMAPAAARLADRGLTVLTSPRLGVEHAVRVWRGLA